MKIFTLFVCLLSVSIFAQSKKLDSFINSQYVVATDSWEETTKREFSYNANNQNTDAYGYINNSGNWELMSESHNTLDSNGNIIEINGNNEGELFKMLFAYNSDNKKIEEIYFSWDAVLNQWNNLVKYTYTYNSINKLDADILYFWNQTISQWFMFTKMTYEYDVDELLTTTYSAHFDAGTSQWEPPSNKRMYQYNINNKPVEWVFYNKDENEEWIENEKNTYSYDTDNNLLASIHSTWDETNTVWIEGNKSIYTQYNNTYSLSDLVLPYPLLEDDESKLLFNHMLLEFENWGKDGSTWLINNKNVLTYSDVIVSVDEIIESKLLVYPNPFENELIFSLKEYKNMKLQIVDVQGKVVSVKTIISNEKINLSSLKKGVYFYKIVSDLRIFNGRLIKV